MIADAEQLVEESWKRNRGIIHYAHNPKNGDGDARGEDFSGVRLSGYNFTEPFQIKTSNNGCTVGLVLPLRSDHPKDFSGRISPEMKAMIDVHAKKHPHVRCILFVAKTDRDHSSEALCRAIWQETISIFKQLQRLNHKKHGKVRPLAFIKGVCYTGQ